MINRLRALIARHCETLKHDLIEIGHDVKLITTLGTASSDQVQQAISRAHKLKGGSGTIGFHEVSETAAKLEVALKMVQQLSGPIPEEVLREIKSQFSRLAALIRDIEPEQSIMYNVQLPRELSHSDTEASAPLMHDQRRSASQ